MHNVAIVGLGMAVGPHAEALGDLQREGRCRVVAAIAPSAARRQAFEATYGFATTDTLDGVLADPTVTVVGILTPPSTHLELVRRVAGAGKNILLEKPLEITTEGAVTLVEVAERAGVRLGVMLQHRFRPAGERLASILAEGRLGRLVNCSTSIRLWRPQGYYDEPGRGTRARDGGGVLLTQGIHTLDLMLALAGPVAEVKGFVTTTPLHRMETEDLVAAAVRFESGAIGVVEATTAAYPGFHETIALAGTNGSAVLCGTALTVAYADGTGETLGADGSAGGTGADPMAFPHDYHRAAWADLLEAVEQGREPRVSGREALGVHRLIDALLAAGGESS